MAIIRHVILDRDGVLNVEDAMRGCVEDWSQWQWIPAALEGLRALTSAGIAISVATNQSCIGRGRVARSQVDAIHRRMLGDAEGHGACISNIYVCPHAPEDRCACRKPAPGLLERAVAASRIPTAHTIMVGDDARDLNAARNAGVSAVLVRSGKGRATEEALRLPAAAVFDDLLKFAQAVIADPARTRTRS